jgi:hypothetical protein
MQTIEAIEILFGLNPNTRLNIKSPWKGNSRVARQWCPFHAEGLWVRLLVKSNDNDEAVFHCESGCSQEQIEARLMIAAARSDGHTPMQVVDADEIAEGRAWLWKGARPDASTLGGSADCGRTGAGGSLR